MNYEELCCNEIDLIKHKINLIQLHLDFTTTRDARKVMNEDVLKALQALDARLSDCFEKKAA